MQWQAECIFQQDVLTRESHLKDSGHSSNNSKIMSSAAGKHLYSAACQITFLRSTGMASVGLQTKQTQPRQVSVCSPKDLTNTWLVSDFFRTPLL